MTGVRVVAQAKVNLTLHVHDRQPDGYHAIVTRFQRLAIGDLVAVEPADALSLQFVWERAEEVRDLGPLEDNLAWRAVRAYERETGQTQRVAIEIGKRIPVGGGLGGGSADAAAVLRALDAMSPAPVGRDALLEIARPLGADVAFLASPHENALAWGRGDEMVAAPSLPTAEVLLVVPPFGINTGEAYRALNRPASAQPSVTVPTGEQPASWATVAAAAHNDFEAVAFAMHPELGEVRRQLSAAPGTILAMMSGSGSTLFAIREPGAPEFGLPAGWRSVSTHTAPEQPVEQLDG